MLKKIFFFLFVCIYFAANAQDTLTLAEGKTLLVYVQELDDEMVTYLKQIDEDVSYQLPLEVILSIKYQEKSPERPDFYNDPKNIRWPSAQDQGDNLPLGSLSDTSKIWVIETKDDNEFFGTILEKNDSEVKLRTNNLGVLSIPLWNIKHMEEVEPDLIKGNELWSENPQSTRYFWGPNSYGLKPGEGYYQNIWVFFNQVSVGITENTSIGFGVVPLFLFAGTSTPVWLTPKFSIPVVRDQFNMGGGALLGTVLGDEGSGFFGIAYGSATFGSRDKNIDLGLGYGFADGEWANSPTITISGMLRTGKKGYVISENYLIGAGGTTVGLLSLGGRRVWGNVALDYGGFLPVGNDIGTFIIIPWIGITVGFGK